MPARPGVPAVTAYLCPTSTGLWGNAGAYTGLGCTINKSMYVLSPLGRHCNDSLAKIQKATGKRKIQTIRLAKFFFVTFSGGGTRHKQAAQGRRAEKHRSGDNAATLMATDHLNGRDKSRRSKLRAAASQQALCKPGGRAGTSKILSLVKRNTAAEGAR